MLLIEKGNVICPKTGKEGVLDILVDGKTIKKIGANLRLEMSTREVESCDIISAEGLFVAPGLVDIHVHFRDPGFTHKEDIHSGAKAAAKGGITTVVLMANTNPYVDDSKVLEYVLEKGSKTEIHVETCGNVTVGMKGKNLVNMQELAIGGAVGFTDDGIPIMEENVVAEAMKRAYELDMPISFHEENPDLIDNNGINRGKASEFYQVGGSPREAEISLIERDLELALRTGTKINIQHISTKEAVELVRKAKKRGKNIHAEATPHHFTLTEEAVITHGSLAKMNPPLRTEEDRRAIIEGLKDGTIDIIATDHAPHTQEEKNLPITEAPSGIIGLETALSVGITSLVKTGQLTIKELIEKMSTNPAELYQLNAGYLNDEGPADLILFDMNQTQVFTEYKSKSSNTPFTGIELYGVIQMTICDGKVIYERKNNS